jgi:hypothetical protein
MTKRPKYMLNNNLINTNPHGFSHRAYVRICICICLLLSSLLLACASTPISKTLPQSKEAVSSVDHTNYRKHVSNNVDTVKAKLKHAQNLETNKQHAKAEQLAQQILVDVELIQIKTQRLNVEQEVKQIEVSIANLNNELNWREPVQLSPLNQ